MLAQEFARIWPLVKAIRSRVVAPVDLLGCEQLAEKDGPAGVFEFQILVAALLSSQTRDEKTAEAVTRLKARGSRHFGADWVHSQTVEDLADALRPVGFYNQKAKNLKSIAKTLLEESNGRVPSEYAALIALPGIGPKMASLILSCAFKQNDSIVVDTHVHRISTALNWGCRICKDACKDAEHTRMALQQWLPKQVWGDYSLMLVGLGQLLNSAKQALIDCCDTLDAEIQDDARKLLVKLGLRL